MTRPKVLCLFLGVGLTLGAYGALHTPGPEWYPDLERTCAHEYLAPTHSRHCGVDMHFVLPWRTREDPRSWPAGPAIVALGDSQTFGQGVEEHEAWPALLGVVNAGRFGANAVDVADTVRRFFETSPAAYTYTMPEWAPPIELDSKRVSPPWPTEPTMFLWLVWPNDVLGSFEDGREARRGEDMRAFLERRYRERDGGFGRNAREAVRAAGGTVIYATVAWYATDPEWWVLDAIEQDLRAAGIEVLPRVLGMPLAKNEFHFDVESHERIAARFAEVVS